MDPIHSFRRRLQEHDIADLAADYIENEVGRHDWRNNWKQHKAKHPGLKHKIKAWLDRFEIDHDPQGLIDYVDAQSVVNKGVWK